MGWLSTFVGISRAGARPPASSAAEAAAAGGVVHNVKAFGAIGDGATKDTQALQQAIDTAERAGGGTVYFPPGTYLSGTLFLKSNVTLHLEAGATLLGSTDIADYPPNLPGLWSYTRTYAVHSLLYGENLHHIAIVGRGTIDGNGAADAFNTTRADHRYKRRPYIIRFATCRNVRVEGITLRNSAMWVQHYLGCDTVVIRDLDVFSHCNRNNDMLNIDSCRNVHVSGCIGDTSDDAIVLKSTTGRICENVTITNCIVSSHSNGFKCGTESNGGFRNITITNCVVRPSREKAVRSGRDEGYAAVALEIMDGGILDRVTVSNIVVEGTKSPIFMRLGNRARKYKEDMPTPGIGTFRNVVISNLVATGASSIGCPIAGLKGHPLENVTLSNIKITCAGGGTLEDAGREIPELADQYPECTMFGTLPAYGFYVRHVDGLTLENIDIRCTEPDRRSALVCDDVRNLSVDGLRGPCIPDGAPMIVLNDVAGALLRGCVAPQDTNVFLRLQGKTDRVRVLANDLSRAAKPFDLAENVPTTALYEAANAIGR
jgi:polygalacturonase